MAHTFSNLLYHVVFGTKDRVGFIDSELRPELHAYLGGIFRELRAIPVIINGTADHVHALVKMPPTVAVADAVRVVKANSSKWAHEQRAKKMFAWQSGYPAFSVSESGAPRVRAYIEEQEEHHRRKTFAEEYIEFLKKHRIPYDERYVFE